MGEKRRSVAAQVARAATATLVALAAGALAAMVAVGVAQSRHDRCDFQYEGDVGAWVCPDRNAHALGAAAVGLAAAGVAFLVTLRLVARPEGR